MKYVSDANKLPWHRSMAFADAIKGSVGWLEVGMRSDWDAEPSRFLQRLSTERPEVKFPRPTRLGCGH